jgi:Carboxypeptidase regulatory-like domain
MSLRSKFLMGAAALSFTAYNLPALAQVTSSTIRGGVTETDGTPIDAAKITITHTPSGSVTNLEARADGRFVASGLRPGGPYSIQVAATGYQTEELEGLSLALDETFSLVVDLEKVDAAIMETVVITASASNLTSVGSGVGRAFGAEDVARLPTITRDPKDIVRLDPRAVVTDGNQGQLQLRGSTRDTTRRPSTGSVSTTISDSIGAATLAVQTQYRWTPSNRSSSTLLTTMWRPASISAQIPTLSQSPVRMT